MLKLCGSYFSFILRLYDVDMFGQMLLNTVIFGDNKDRRNPPLERFRTVQVCMLVVLKFVSTAYIWKQSSKNYDIVYQC